MERYQFREVSNLFRLRLLCGAEKRRTDVVLDEVDGTTQTLLESGHVRRTLTVLRLKNVSKGWSQNVFENIMLSCMTHVLV